MKLDIFIFQIALIFLPGMIWAQLDKRFAAKQKASEVEYFVRAFMFGTFTYLGTFAFHAWRGWPFAIADLSAADKSPVLNAAIAWKIGESSLVAFMLGIAWIYGRHKKLLTRLLIWLGATKKYGDEDVSDYTFDSPTPEVKFAHFRDFEYELVYSGWIDTYSETDKLRELVLRANRAMLTSTMRMAFDTTIERRRKRASQCRCSSGMLTR